MGSTDDQPNFFDNKWLAWRTRRAMHRGVRDVVHDLKTQGVVRAIPFLGFHVEPVVWLVTTTDAEREAVIQDGIPREFVIERLRRAGVRPDLAAGAGVVVESEETVDRDFGGNWRIAMQ
jgi:hypothetical protein